MVDRITGFTGVVTGRCDYITGCNRYQVQPKVGSDGKFADSVWFDEHMLDVDTRVEAINVQPETAEKPGSWGSDPR